MHLKFPMHKRQMIRAEMTAMRKEKIPMGGLRSVVSHKSDFGYQEIRQREL